MTLPSACPATAPTCARCQRTMQQAVEMIQAAKRPVILAGHGVLMSRRHARAARVRREDPHPGGDDPARHRRLPRQPPAQPGHDGHARRGLGQPCHPGGRPAAGPRDAFRRPGDRQPEDLCAPTPRRSTSRSILPRSTRTSRSTWRWSATCAIPSSRSLPHLQACDHSEWLAHIDEMRGDSAVRDIQNLPDDGHLYAAHVINDLWRYTDGEALVVTDVGQNQMWTAQYYQPRQALHLHHLRRAGHDGLWPAGRHRRQVRPPGGGSLGDRRRRRLPDDPGRAVHRRPGRASRSTSPSSTTATWAWCASGRSSSTSAATQPHP